MSDKDEKYVLAIDLGTSGSKTAIVSIYGEVVDFDFAEVPLLLLPNGGAEQNPADWWNAIMTTSKRLLARRAVNPLRGAPCPGVYCSVAVGTRNTVPTSSLVGSASCS